MLLEPLCRGIGDSNVAALLVSELHCDQVPVPPLLVEQCARNAAKSMCSPFLFRVPEPPERGVQRIFTEWPIPLPDGREYIPASFGSRLEFAENSHRLARERHDMHLAHLHPLAGNSPLTALKCRLPTIPQHAAHRMVRSEPQRRVRRRLAVVLLDSAQLLSDLGRVGNRRIALRPRG